MYYEEDCFARYTDKYGNEYTYYLGDDDPGRPDNSCVSACKDIGRTKTNDARDACAHKGYRFKNPPIPFEYFPNRTVCYDWLNSFKQAKARAEAKALRPEQVKKNNEDEDIKGWDLTYR